MGGRAAAGPATAVAAILPSAGPEAALNPGAAGRARPTRRNCTWHSAVTGTIPANLRLDLDDSESRARHSVTVAASVSDWRPLPARPASAGRVTVPSPPGHRLTLAVTPGAGSVAGPGAGSVRLRVRLGVAGPASHSEPRADARAGPDRGPGMSHCHTDWPGY